MPRAVALAQLHKTALPACSVRAPETRGALPFEYDKHEVAGQCMLGNIAALTHTAQLFCPFCFFRHTNTQTESDTCIQKCCVLYFSFTLKSQRQKHKDALLPPWLSKVANLQNKSHRVLLFSLIFYFPLSPFSHSMSSHLSHHLFETHSENLNAHLQRGRRRILVLFLWGVFFPAE